MSGGVIDMAEATGGATAGDRIDTIDQLHRTVREALQAGASPELIRMRLDKVEMDPKVREVYEAAGSIEELAGPASGLAKMFTDTIGVRRPQDV
jgi:hypothetical protein